MSYQMWLFFSKCKHSHLHWYLMDSLTACYIIQNSATMPSKYFYQGNHFCFNSHSASLMCVCVLGHAVVSDSLRLRGLWPLKLLRPWNSPGKNTGVGYHFLLQGIFPTQESKSGLQDCRQILYHLRHLGSPNIFNICYLNTE